MREVLAIRKYNLVGAPEITRLFEISYNGVQKYEVNRNPKVL